MNLNNLKFQQSVLEYLNKRDKFMFRNGSVLYVYEGFANGVHTYTEFEDYRNGRRGAYNTSKNAIVDVVDESGF